MPCIGLVRTAAPTERGEMAASAAMGGEAKAVRRVVKLAGGWDASWTGARILIKPNLVAVPPHPRNGAVTSVAVCQAVADLVREKGGEPLIADSAGVGADTEDVMAVCGYQRIRALGYQVVDLKKTPVVEVPVPRHTSSGAPAGLLRLHVFRPAIEADVIISVPVMKTHDQLGVSLALKNLKGLLADEDKKRLHRTGVVSGICDLLGVLPPVHAIVDGTVGQEGLGPIFGRPVALGLLLAGTDPVAVDTFTAWLMGFAPEELPLLVQAAARGLGCADLGSIAVRGEDPRSLRRRFLRAEEDGSFQVPGCQLIFTPGTCTACHHTVLSVCADLKEKGWLHLLAGSKILAGPVASERLPGGIAPSTTILVGGCTAAYRHLGVWVPGCPPRNEEVTAALQEAAATVRDR